MKPGPKRRQKAGRHKGAAKVTVDTDFDREYYGEAFAEIDADLADRLIWFRDLLGKIMLEFLEDSLRPSTPIEKRNPVRRRMVDLLLWFLTETRDVCCCGKDPHDLIGWIRAMHGVSTNVQTGRMRLRFALECAMGIAGDKGRKEIYVRHSELQRWIQREFYKGEVLHGGTLTNALRARGIELVPGKGRLL